MKTVFTNSSDVIHLFAQRTQDKARCSNVYFNDLNHIYSYGQHYLLGKFITNDKNELAIVINNTGYSVTTSKHIREISQATRQYKQFFELSSNGKKVLNQLELLAEKLQCARKPELYINPALSLYDQYIKFLNWSGRFSYELDQINEVIKIFKGADYSEYLQAKNKAIKRAEQKRIRNEKKQFKNNLQKFYNYELDYLYNNCSHEDYLRISKDGLFIETSQRIKVNIEEAKILYRLIEAKKDIKGFVIGNYTVISINGVLKIGCHNINMNDVHRIGRLIVS